MGSCYDLGIYTSRWGEAGNGEKRHQGDVYCQRVRWDHQVYSPNGNFVYGRYSRTFVADTMKINDYRRFPHGDRLYIYGNAGSGMPKSSIIL